MRFPLFERHPREELSGYLDNELVANRVEAVKTHLTSCPTCHAELEALRTLKSQLAALPESPAPRSFALTPQMAQHPVTEPVRVRPPSRVEALSNGMRLAGAGMAAALVVVMVLNFSGSGSDNSDDSLSASEALNQNATFQYSDSVGALPTDVAPTDAATYQDPRVFSTAVPPAASPAGGATDAPAAGGGVGGGVGSAPNTNSGGVTSDGDQNTELPETTPTLVPGTIPEPTSDTAIGVPAGTPAALPGEIVPSVVPATEDAEKSLEDFDARAISSIDADANLDINQTAPELDQTGAPVPDDGGIDILLLVAIVLAAGVVLAFAGSVLIPRIARGDG